MQRAVRSARAAGLTIARVEIDKSGKIAVVVGEPTTASGNDTNPNPWDTVINDPNPAGEDDTTVKRPPGRPSKASETQQAEVLHRREQGKSMQAIAKETGLGFRTCCKMYYIGVHVLFHILGKV